MRLVPKRKFHPNNMPLGLEQLVASILSTYLRDGVVTTKKIAPSAVTTAKLNDAAVEATKIAASAVEEAKIAADAVTATKIAVAGLDGTTGNVSADHIVATMLQTDCVTSVKIQADAVTATKINVVGLDGATGRIVVADATDANVVTGGVNTYATTLIQAGKILISGATTLNQWGHASNATLIDGGDIYTGSVTATQISAETITATEIHADAITTVKINDNAVTQAKIYAAVAGDLPEASANTEGNYNLTTYIKRKEISVGRAGAYRIKFDLKTTDGGVTAAGRIYKNGVAVGTERTTVSTTYVTMSEDISDWAPGDLCQLYVKIVGLAYVYYQNFRVYSSNALIATVTLDT